MLLVVQKKKKKRMGRVQLQVKQLKQAIPASIEQA